MKKTLLTLSSSILAGIFIGLGGFVFLSVSNLDILGWQKVLGSFLFASGLFAICTFELALFTGKVGRIVENKPKFIGELGIIFVGNLIGVLLIALITRGTRSDLVDLANTIMTSKYDTNPFVILLLSIPCGFCMEFAVAGYRKLKPSPTAYISIFLGVMIFILCGFEHVIANLYYLFVSMQFNSWTIILFVLMILGNSIGAIFLAFLLNMKDNKEVKGE